MSTPNPQQPAPRGIRVDRSLTIPDDELAMTFSPSGGPGGQHANKTATRVELVWNVKESRVLGEARRARLLANLSSRLDSSGDLRLMSDNYRSQMRNREDARDRLAKIVADGLKPAKPRTKTKPTKAAKEKRLRAKARRGSVKEMRRPPNED